jgi:CheY-like chemotaxis protein
MKSEKKRILVVDDSEDLRELYRDVLEAAGYAVDVADGGVEAFIQARALRPDLVISDVVMPGMDGLHLLQKLRSDLPPPVPPVILCSGFDMTEGEALRRGALMFLRKPFDRGDLVDCVARELRSERLPTELDRRGREHARAARHDARDLAAARVRNLAPAGLPASRQEMARMMTGALAWTRAYFGVGDALVSLFEDGTLQPVAVANDGVRAHDLDAASARPELQSILESGATLVINDVARHPSFAQMGDTLPDIRFFAGVPLIVDGHTPVGVACLADRQPRSFTLEDLQLLQQFARRGALFVEMVGGRQQGGPVPGRFGPGVLAGDMFGQLVELELRLLEAQGGSIALAALERLDVAEVSAALARAPNRERLVAGVLAGHVAIVARSPDADAGDRVDAVVSDLLRGATATAAGITALSGAELPAFTGQDLMRLSRLALERALSDGGGAAHIALAVGGTAHA